MILSLISNSLSDQLAAALCNTLMHSLWQGVLLAAAAGLIIICTRKASPALRYNLLLSALLLFAAGITVTFAGQYQKKGEEIRAQPIAQSLQVSSLPVTADHRGVQPAVAPQQRLADRVNGYLNDHHDTIVLVWFLIICVRSLQFGVGLYGTYRLKRVRVSAVKGHWPERMRQLAGALGIKQIVPLLESALAKAPMMIGHLKPVVLVPAGLLAALPPEEIEAILIHELAHIRRRDYLVNILQSLMEIVFFFNPAVWWVSKLIKTERENCCDDVAVAQNNNKINYIRALVACEEYQASVPAYAIAFPGGKNTLLGRVKRMAGNCNYSLNVFEKTVLAVCLVGAGLFMMAFSAVRHPQKDTVENTHPKILAAVQILKPADQFRLAESPVRHKQQPVHKDTTVKPQPSASATPQPVQPAAGAPIIPDLGDTLVKYDIIPGKFDMKARLNSAELVINGVKQPETVRALVFSKFLNDTCHSVDINYVYKNARDSANTGYNYQPYRASHEKYLERRAQYRSDEASIKIDLMRDNLVSDTNHIHFTINDKEFILNGVPQSPEVYQRYKDKYCRCSVTGDAGWSWSHATNRPTPQKN